MAVEKIDTSNLDSILDNTDNKIHLYANYTPKTFTLTIDNDGATKAHTISSTTLTYDSTMPTFSVLPEKTGCTFLGYYDGNDVQYVTADGSWTDGAGKIRDGYWTSDNNLNLKAKWSANTYNITYVLNGGINDINNP